MTILTDTRERPRLGQDSIRSLLINRFGMVYIDSKQQYGPLSGESQTVTSVRTTVNKDPFWNTYSKPFRDYLKRRRKIDRLLRNFNRKTNPNPCLIKRSVTKCSKDISVEYLTGLTTYPKVIVAGNQAKWVLCTRAGIPDWIGPITSKEQRFIDTAVLKAYAKANSPSMPGLVYLGELGETIRMLRKPLSGIRTFLKKMRNHRSIRIRRGLTDVTSSITDQWLEYRYGILPLMAQVDEICDAVAKRLLFGYPIKLTRDGLKVIDKDYHVLVPSARVSPTYTYGDYYYSEKVEIGAFCTLAHNLQMDEGKFFGLRPRDIVPTIWELVPYSFCVDWIFNVGDWLEAVTPNPKLNVRSTSVSLKRSITRKVRLLNVGYGANVYGRRQCDESCETIEERLDRIINVPKPVFPVFNEDFFKFVRVLDSVALSFGQLKRTLRTLR